MIFHPIGSFRPDSPPYAAPVSTDILNAFPISLSPVGGSQVINYSPLREQQAYSNPVDSRVFGAFAFKDELDVVRTFAGNTTKLLRLTVGTPTFANVSKVGGYNTTDSWEFELYGNLVIASNFNDPIQQFTIGTSTVFADFPTAAPRAKRIAVVKEWLVLGNTSDATDGHQQQRVWWSGVSEPTNFPTPGTVDAARVQSDFQDLVGNHGKVQGIIPNLIGADAVIMMERTIFRMNYVGPPSIFSFESVQGAKGTFAPNSITSTGGVVYYYGEDGFYAFDGVRNTAIGNSKVDQFFQRDVDLDNIDRVYASFDPNEKIILWIYPDRNAVDAQPNKVLIYNYHLNEWGFGRYDAEIIFPGLTYGLTLEEMNNLSNDIDTLPASLDSRLYAGGVTILGGFDHQERLVYFQGQRKQVFVETPELKLPNNRRHYILGARPITDSNIATVQIGTRENQSADYSFSDSVTPNVNAIAPFRKVGRYAKARVDVAAGNTFTFISGVELKLKPAGEK